MGGMRLPPFLLSKHSSATQCEAKDFIGLSFDNPPIHLNTGPEPDQMDDNREQTPGCNPRADGKAGPDPGPKGLGRLGPVPSPRLSAVRGFNLTERCRNGRGGGKEANRAKGANGAMK